MKSRYLLLLLPLFLLTGAFKSVPGKDFVSDFDILEQTLRELHPALYNVVGKTAYDKLVADTRLKLAITSDKRKALYIFQDYIFQLGDGHASTLDAYFERDFDNILPFKIAITDTQLYILHYPGHSEKEGIQILSINGTSSHELIDSLRIFFSNDGARSIHPAGLAPLFNSLYAQFCGQPDTFRLNTSAGKLDVPAMSKRDSLYREMIAYSWLAPGKENAVFADSGSFGYARFNNFLATQGKVKIEENYNRFVDEMISTNKKAIVIDLRYNDGGFPVMATRMAERITDTAIAPADRLFISEDTHPSYAALLNNYPCHFLFSAGTKDRGEMLEKVKFERTLLRCRTGKPVYPGKVYVLVSDVTASAATMFCSILRYNSNVTFIGAETGGAINYFWAHKLCQIRLPFSGINLTFPLELIELKNGSTERDKPAGLVPDVQIHYSITDLLQGADKEMNYVHSILSSK